jgi:diguanylate cyclase (GGDEF)-like protein/PAS domain S-box-containing protein
MTVGRRGPQSSSGRGVSWRSPTGGEEQLGGESNQEQWRSHRRDEHAADTRLFDIVYSSGVFDENAAATEASIEVLVRSLGPQDRLSVAAAIRQIVRQHTEEALRRAEDRMQLAQEVGRIGCFEIDMRDGTSVGTPAFFELYGLPADRGSWTQQEWLSYVHPDDRSHVVAHLKEVALGAEMTTIEYRVVRSDGEVRWTASRARVETGPDGRQTRAYGIQQDITERKLAELALAESEEHHRHFIEVNPACFWTATAGGRIQVANASAAARFGVPMEVSAAVAGPPLVHPEDRLRVLGEWRRSLASGRPYDVEHRMRWGEGEYRWVHARAYPRVGDAGDVIAWYGATEDIHERKLAEQRMSWMARHDPLTGLANRLHFRDRLECAINRSAGRKMVALLLLDLDGFKLVNDTYGHDVGDELLVEIAGRLRNVAGRHGMVSRLGGDEFTVVVPRLKSEAWLEEFAGRILVALREPLVLRGLEIRTGVSIGAAVYPQDDAFVPDLLKDADLALYAAKARGRGCWVRFRPELRPQAGKQAERHTSGALNIRNSSASRGGDAPR